MSKAIQSGFLSRKAVICFCWSVWLAVPALVSGQTNYYARNGTEYMVVGSLPGDQVWPDVAVTTNRGFVVWEDNITDGNGSGVSARRLDGTLSGVSSAFRVNAQGTNDQENPRVALIKNGGTVFAWQGGKPSYQHVYVRFLNSANTFLTTTDVLVSTFTNNFQVNPSVAGLNNSNVVVIWASFNQAGSNSLQDVYGQIFSPAGQKVGTNFLINQFISYNQRRPAVTALANGGFVVVWVSEQQRLVAPVLSSASDFVTPQTAPAPSIDIYARLYNSNGVAAAGEFLVNADSNPCMYPRVASASDGSFLVTWCAFDRVNSANGLDIYARAFSSTGAGGAVARVNSYLYGDQYLPQVRANGGEYMIAWTSLGQDGSLEGVYGQFVHKDGSLVGGEFRVNSTTAKQQMHPVLASDGANQFLAVWTSFNLAAGNFDLSAQRYINVAAALLPMDAPFVNEPFTLNNGVYQPQLQISWPPLLGISVSNYEVYVDGSGTPMVSTSSNIWTMTAANGLTSGSTHWFQVDYMTTAGARSPLSPSTYGTTWSGGSYYGIPFEWMEQYYGLNFASWPGNVNAPLVPRGSTLSQVFLSGGSPLDPDSWLKTSLIKTSQGMSLSWNTQPGLTYQVQVTTDFSSWHNLPPPYDTPRFATGNSDSIPIGSGSAGYYRVMLLRQ